MTRFILIRLPVVEEMTGFKKSWLYALMEKGQFPQPVKIGSRSVAWVESEVNEWIKNQISKHRTVNNG